MLKDGQWRSFPKGNIKCIPVICGEVQSGPVAPSSISCTFPNIVPGSSIVTVKVTIKATWKSMRKIIDKWMMSCWWTNEWHLGLARCLLSWNFLLKAGNETEDTTWLYLVFTVCNKFTLQLQMKQTWILQYHLWTKLLLWRIFSIPMYHHFWVWHSSVQHHRTLWCHWQREEILVICWNYPERLQHDPR